MTNMRSLRKPPAVTIAAAAALALAACGSSGGSTPSSSNGKVPLTWWTNATAGQLKTVWQQAATAFHAAHPNVTIQVEPLQNEAFTTKVPPALASSNPPDIYQQWGGGQEATQIPSGKVADLSKLSSGWIGQVGSAAQAWQVNGKQYGVPYDLHTVGFWYRKDLFARAGITTAPVPAPPAKGGHEGREPLGLVLHASGPSADALHGHQAVPAGLPGHALA